MTNERDWSIQEVARLAGTTSRTLRHYGAIGLLPATSVGANGYRRYDADALLRLQRILLLRDLGLGLPAVGEVLRGQRDDAAALLAHLHWLEAERERVTAQIASVTTTIEKLRRGEQLMAEEMLNGFDHTVYREEVEARWGADTYAAGDDWWRAKTVEEKARWQAEQAALASDWADAAASADSSPTDSSPTDSSPTDSSATDSSATDSGPAGQRAQALARRQYDWLAAVPGTPRLPGRSGEGVLHRAGRALRVRRAFRRELRRRGRRGLRACGDARVRRPGAVAGAGCSCGGSPKG